MQFRNKLVLALALALPLGAACGPQFSVSLVKDPAMIKMLGDAIVASNKESTLVRDQVLLVQQSSTRFFIAPFISTNRVTGGCYVQSMTADNKLNKAILLASNEDVLACVSVIALFRCRLSASNAIGVIYGMRLGATHHYTEGRVFVINPNGDLEENENLSAKIETDASAAIAKQKLGCLK